MKFVVRRATIWDDGKPCEEAYVGEIKGIFELPFENFEDFEKRTGMDFLSEGMNHKITENGIVREQMVECWYIDFNSLEELIAFKEKYGNITIEKSHWDNESLQIEIDDLFGDLFDEIKIKKNEEKN